ncbi:uncharacterized protein LOC141665455 [Apium graveolens]|uniref:uncharacterized protein LOC141665455 n=1 Tax=Apium graveolens TaxID=4045 RepID=UPI003D7A7DE9
MGLLDKEMSPSYIELYGFISGPMCIVGRVKLPVTLGDEPLSTTQMEEFMVGNEDISYNAIIGRPLLKDMRVITSIYHLSLKFLTPNGVGCVRGNQSQSRECYVQALHTAEQMYKHMLLEDEGPSMDTQGEVPMLEAPSPKYLEDGDLLIERIIEEVNDSDFEGFDGDPEPHNKECDEVHVEINLDPRMPEAKETTGVVRDTVFILVNDVDSSKEIRIGKQLKAGAKEALTTFLKANLDGFAWCHSYMVGIDPNVMCHHLNIDPEKKAVRQKRRAISGERAMNLKEEVDRLLKVDATYQRLVNRMFKNQIGRTMEVYVDDMLVKSRVASDHVTHLAEMFNILRRFYMKLNPQKCVFGVELRKFLGFIVNHHGIEANPAKIKAMVEMRSPCTIKKVECIIGRVVGLNRFVSKSSDRCREFFAAIKKGEDFDWTLECEAAFQKLKQQLGSPPLLSTLVEGGFYILCLAVSEFSISAVLVREEGKIQFPVYYMSKWLLDVESHYTNKKSLHMH